MSTMSSYFRVMPEVQEALAAQKPVVALESSIIAHGMPYPTNIETALACENIIREQGAIPATIAIKDHKICVGLSHEEIEAFGDKQGKANVLKLSRKDLAYALTQGAVGACTVAATMIAAHRAGIRIFATGGIGGVHRGAESSMDISADLDELAQTPVAVVSAGVKSILDIGRTLEVLETKGVPIVGYQTNDMPAFFCRTSGFVADCKADSAEEIARLLRVHWEIAPTHGVLVVNPVPTYAALEENYVSQIIDDALVQAQKENIRHKAVTPFLLGFIAEKSGALSLKANCALVQSNAALAASIARQFIKVEAAK